MTSKVLKCWKTAQTARMHVQLVIRFWGRPSLGWQHSFVGIDHEIFSTVNLAHQQIQEGTSVSGEKNVHDTG